MNDRKELKQAYKERKITGGVFIIKNNINGRILLDSAINIIGSKNRFDFSKATGSCVNLKLASDWKEFGKDAFTFEILEEIEKKEDQTEKDFGEDVKLLEEIWMEKLEGREFY